MFRLNRLLFVCFLAVTMVSTAAAQDAANSIVQTSSATITASASGERVRITAPSSVVQLHVEVYAVSGEKLFDQEIRGGNVFDWHLQDGQAQRLAPGNYVCVVTAKSVSGRLTEKIGTVSVAEKSVSVQPADSPKLSVQQSQAIGPVEENSSWMVAGEAEPQTPTVIAHDGTDGQMIRGRGALTFRIGNFFSGIDTEQMRLTEAGNLGIGTSEPMAKLDVAGTIRAERFLVVKPGQTSNAAGNPRQTTDAADPVQPLVAGTGTTDSIAKWTDNAGTLGNAAITETGGKVGIGTTTPTQALEVANGRITITGSQTSAVPGGLLEIGTTLANNNNQASGIRMRNTFNGNATNQVALDVAPTFAPSANISLARGFISAAFFAPPPGVTITDALGGVAANVYNNTGGAVTNGTAFALNSPIVFGPLKPTTQYGLHINNQGIAGTANSYGLFVDAQSGSTNSFSAIFARGNVGIGTTTPSVQLDILNQNTSDDVALQVTSNGTTEILGRAANGSLAVPTSTILGQSLMFLGGGGHNGSGFTSARAGIDFQASQNWTASANGTRMSFLTANNGSTTGTERMRIEPDGDIGIGTTTPLHHLHVKGVGTQSIGIESSNANLAALHLTGGREWVLESGSSGSFFINDASVGANWLTILGNGDMGFGTPQPELPIHITRSKVIGSIMTIANEGGGGANGSDDADLLRLRIRAFANATQTNNYITFVRGDNVPMGAIQGNNSGGIEYLTSGSDYAEFLPRLNPSEQIQPGEIVGLYGGRVTKQTRAATKIMAVSTGPSVLGNDPGEKARSDYERVAFIGQVKVRVRGKVEAGDFIIASGMNDGTGIAASPERITTEQFDQVVGQAWEASADPGVKSVRVAVGLNRRDPAVGRLVEYSRKQTARIAALEARLAAFEAKLESKTSTRNLKANHRRKSSDRPRPKQFFKDRSQSK